MGITGLLPFLEKSSKKTNINEFAGGTVAIDAYCWLHKGVFSCADKLSMGQATDAYVNYCMKFINMLLSHKIKPILVFDGRHLPAKAQTETKRRESREANKRKAVELMQMGQHAQARILLRRSIDITHEMALNLIRQCQKMNIDCIVAPYEADAQLAYLNIIGIADVVITEDSDLTLFGCKKIFFKMDINGSGVLVDQERLHLAMGVSYEHFSMDNFRYMCILSGCDYLPSLPGIGLVKAKKFITINTDCDIHRALTRLGSYLNMKSLVVTKEYRDSFILAVITFKHQLVFCPLQRKQVRLSPPQLDVTEEQLYHAGVETSPDIALDLAFGNCDPFTLKMLHNFNPDSLEYENNERNTWGIISTNSHHISVWSKQYKLKQNQLGGQLQASGKILNCPSTSNEKTVHRTNRLKRTVLMRDEDEPECQRLKQQEILDMYKSKTTEGTENNGILEISFSTEEELASPVSIRRANPFSKQDSDKEVSPSLLSYSKRRTRGRNIMRVRRTIIDETNVTESKFFAKSPNKNDILTDDTKLYSLNNSNKILVQKENVKLKNNDEVRNTNFQGSVIANKMKIDSHPMDIDHNMHNASFTASECKSSEPLNIFSYNFEESYKDVEMKEVPSRTNATEGHILTNSLTSQEIYIDPDFLIQEDSINAVNSSLFAWSNRNVTEYTNDSTKQSKIKTFSTFDKASNKKKSRTSSAQQNNEMSSTQKQQSLLSMYGFGKKKLI